MGGSSSSVVAWSCELCIAFGGCGRVLRAGVVAVAPDACLTWPIEEAGCFLLAAMLASALFSCAMWCAMSLLCAFMLLPPLVLFLGAFPSSPVGHGSEPLLNSAGPWICVLLAEVLDLQVLVLPRLWRLPLAMIMGLSLSVVLSGNSSTWSCPCARDALSSG